MNNTTGRGEYLCALQNKLGYTFRERATLDEALTHSSYANENAVPFNERLEFLGDAVLELITSRKLFAAYPDYDEGQLTRLRAQIVCKNSLAEWAREMGLASLIRVGRSLVKCGPTESVCADCVEALFGAVYLDGGYESARMTVEKFLETKPQISGATVVKDPKTKLQEYFQQKGMDVPRYETVERVGPEHALRFRVELTLGRKKLAGAWGQSIQEAEFRAAEEALKALSGDTVAENGK